MAAPLTLSHSSPCQLYANPSHPTLMVWIVLCPSQCPLAFSLSHQAPVPSLSCAISRPGGSFLMSQELAFKLKGQSDPSWQGRPQQRRPKGLSVFPWQGRPWSAIEKTSRRKGVLTSQSFRPDEPIFPEETALHNNLQ